MCKIYEYINTFIPLVVFCLGILAVPLIESRKEKNKAKKIYSSLTVEIKDELNELPGRLVRMAEVLHNLKSSKAGLPKIDRPWKYIPRSTSLFFLETAINFSFTHFDKNQRYAIKSLLVQISAIDDYLRCMKNTEISDETITDLINNCKRYLYTGACMLNTMRVVTKSPSKSLSANDKEIINGIMREMGIKLSADDLIIKNTVTLKLKQ